MVKTSDGVAGRGPESAPWAKGRRIRRLGASRHHMIAGTANLGELCEIDRRSVRPGDSATDALPFVGVEHVGGWTGILDFSAGSRIGNRKSTAFRFDERHVLYAKLRPYLNKVATPGFAGVCSTELVPLLPRDGVDRDFLAYLLRRGEAVDIAVASATGSRMPRADMKALMAMQVPFPAMERQREISGILKRATRICLLRKKVADCMLDFAPALFAKMFGDPVTNPMGWPVARLGEICEIDRHALPEGGGEDSSLRFIGVENVTKYSGVLNFNAQSRIGNQKSAVFYFDSRHVLYSRLRPYLNKVAIPNFKGRCSTELIPLLTHDGVNRYFLAYLLRSAGVMKIAVDSAVGARMPRTDMKVLMAMPVPLPAYDKQLQFAAVAREAARMISLIGSATEAALNLNVALTTGLLEECL